MREGKYKTSEEFIAAYKGILNPSTIKSIVGTYYFTRNVKSNPNEPNFVGHHFGKSVELAEKELGIKDCGVPVNEVAASEASRVTKHSITCRGHCVTSST